jgi:type I restriction enzyme, S subunit
MSVRWPLVPLGELLAKSDETITPHPNTEYAEITVRLWGKGVVLRGMVTGAQVVARRYVARRGQFILSRIDARNGALGIVPPTLDGAIVSNDFPIFRIAENRLVPAYLGWLCKTGTFVEECRRASEGTTNRVRLQEDKFLARAIHLPPHGEQKRIVAWIDEMEAKVREAKELREQAVGEAGALWRASLRHIFLRHECVQVPLHTVCSAIIDNLHSNPRYADTGVPCVRSPDVGWGTLNLDTALRTDESEYGRRTVRGEPQADDIVLVREGGGTGKAAMVAPGQRFSLGQRVMMLRPDKQRVLPKFFLYQILSPLIQDDHIVPLSKGSASPHLNIGSLKRFPFRLPSSAEQCRIVTELDLLRAEMDMLKRLQSETAEELDALLPSVLSKAFAGEL